MAADDATGGVLVLAAGAPMHDHDEVAALRARIIALVAENARLAEEVAVRDSFLAVAAHELKNALTPVVARVERLRRRLGTWPAETIDANLKHVEDATALFARRATTLLDVSRMTTGKLALDRAPVAVGPVARAVVEIYQPLANHAGCTLALALPPVDLIVSADDLALEQILDNLVSNAIKYGGGTPILVSAQADAAAGVARLVVADGGPGIPPEAQARIFERFERAVRRGDDAPGFGVGLWVVRQLCEALDGRIGVVSIPGQGSTFTVTLPLHLTKDTP